MAPRLGAQFSGFENRKIGKHRMKGNLKADDVKTNKQTNKQKTKQNETTPTKREQPFRLLIVSGLDF